MSWFTYRLLLRLAYSSGLLLLAVPGRIDADQPLDPPRPQVPTNADEPGAPAPHRRAPVPTLSELVPDVLPPPRWGAGPTGTLSLDVGLVRLPSAVRELDKPRLPGGAPSAAPAAGTLFESRPAALIRAVSPAPRAGTGLLARIEHSVQRTGPPALNSH